MIRVSVRSKHALIKLSLEQLVSSLGFAVSSSGKAEVALWELCSYEHRFPPPTKVPTLGIIRVSGNQALELLEAGYRGYIHQNDKGDQLKEAVRAVARGEIWAERRVLSEAIFTKPNRAGHPTPREREVLSLVMGGLSNKEIAQQLNIAENTVKGHVSSLLRNYGVKSRMNLMASQRKEDS